MLRLLMAVMLCALVGAVPADAGPKPKARAQLDSVSVHLFLSTSGTLSTDVTTMPDFFARNFVPHAKEIADNERFDAILVRVRFTSPKEVFAEGMQAEVVMTNRRTRKIVRRERIADVYIGDNGWTFVPVFASRVGCSELDVVVTGGGRKIAKSLGFSCGE
jgi:hypothetical protein